MITLRVTFFLVQTQGITFCSSDPELTNCEFPAHCVNTSSGSSCVCSDGYSGDPAQCEGEYYMLGVHMESKGLPKQLSVKIVGNPSDIALSFSPFSRLKIAFKVPAESLAHSELTYCLRNCFSIENISDFKG